MGYISLKQVCTFYLFQEVEKNNMIASNKFLVISANIEDAMSVLTADALSVESIAYCKRGETTPKKTTRHANS